MIAWRILRLLLLAALIVAPLGRIGMTAAGASAPAPAAAGHCSEAPASAPERGEHEGMAADCMIACAAMASMPAPCVAAPPAAGTVPGAAPLSDPAGIRPDAELPPPRFS